MIRWLLGLVFVTTIALLNISTVQAEPALGLQPLQYKESLGKGERKKAYLDVTNPTPQPITVQFSVQGFKQIDNKGTLSFYDDERLRSGILLDHQEIEIPVKKTLRLFFIVDGTKLPTGDVFAAIFAQTKSIQEVMMPEVRVGTLLILTNETPGLRQARVESLSMPVLHTGDSIKGEVEIKNVAPASSASGFFPEITLGMWPFGSTRTINGPLVYAGNTRTIQFDQPSNSFGLYKISAQYGDSSKGRWVVLMTGMWKWLAPAIFIGVIIVLLFFKFAHKRRSVRR